MPNWKSFVSPTRSATPTWSSPRKTKSARFPTSFRMKNMDVKIGGNEFDRLRRWYKQGKLSKSRGIVRQRFPQTSSPRMIAKLIRQGILQNARFAAAVLVRGMKRGKGKRRSAPADSHRLHFSHALSDPPARPLHHAGRVRDRARRRAIHQIFSARTARVSSRPKRLPAKRAARSSPASATTR